MTNMDHTSDIIEGVLLCMHCREVGYMARIQDDVKGTIYSAHYQDRYIQRNDVAGNLKTVPNPWHRLEESVASNIPTTSYPHK